MRNPTKFEKQFHDRLCNEVGCICCRNERQEFNNWVSIHHCDGRTKKGCHMKVLSLCYFHHQGQEGIHTLSKKVWEKRFGTQEELMSQCKKILEGK